MCDVVNRLGRARTCTGVSMLRARVAYIAPNAKLRTRPLSQQPSLLRVPDAITGV